MLHNIDHLATLPAPAFVAGYKCFPRFELRAAVAVVQPAAVDWERALRLMREASTAIYDDLGEGSGAREPECCDWGAFRRWHATGPPAAHWLSPSSPAADHAVWRHLYPRVHELPIGYAALRSSDLLAAEWPKVHVLHDPNLLRKAARAGWKESGMSERIKLLDAAQSVQLASFSEVWSAQSERERDAPPPDPNAKRQKGKKSKRGRRKAA